MATPARSDTDGYIPQFSKADQIKQLNDIDKKITQLIKSAGEAVKTLTSIQTQSPSLRQLAYQHAADLYFQKLHEIDTASKAQAKALRRAKIIQRDAAVPSTTTNKERSEALDIGWLNTRSNQVGRDLEVELWEKAGSFLKGKQGEGKELKGLEQRAFNQNDMENMEALRTAHGA